MTSIEIPEDLLQAASREDRWAFNPAAMLRDLGYDPDPWQTDLLRGNWRTETGQTTLQAILLCSRQSGKSTVAGLLGLHDALFSPPSKPALVLVLSASGRQSKEFFKTKILAPYRQLGRPVPPEAELTLSLELTNGSRLVALPTSQDTIVGYSGVTLLLVDEAARVPDALYYNVRPMLATSDGKIVLLSTPQGKRGFFYEEWIGQGQWHRVRQTVDSCKRISPAFLEEERRSLGPRWYRQEYECSFEDMVAAVFAQEDLAAAMADDLGPLWS
jgi:hypothetical protein